MKEKLIKKGASNKPTPKKAGKESGQKEPQKTYLF